MSRTRTTRVVEKVGNCRMRRAMRGADTSKALARCSARGPASGLISRVRGDSAASAIRAAVSLHTEAGTEGPAAIHRNAHASRMRTRRITGHRRGRIGKDHNGATVLWPGEGTTAPFVFRDRELARRAAGPPHETLPSREIPALFRRGA